MTSSLNIVFIHIFMYIKRPQILKRFESAMRQNCQIILEMHRV